MKKQTPTVLRYATKEQYVAYQWTDFLEVVKDALVGDKKKIIATLSAEFLIQLTKAWDKGYKAGRAE